MNETIRRLKAHCSIRKYADRTIPEATLKALIEAGQHASTSSFIQAVSVINVTDQSLRQQLAELCGNQPYVASASHFLVFCADLHRNQQRVSELGSSADFSWTEQFLAASVDVALFAQNVVIAAESLDLGTCYIGGIRNNPDAVSDLLSLPELVYPVFGLCLGYPAQQPLGKPRLPLETVLFENRYSDLSQQKKSLDAYDETIKAYYQERSAGKLQMSFSQQMEKQSATQSRLFMQEFLRARGFMQK